VIVIMYEIHELIEFLLKGKRNSKILLVTHDNADVDACASLYAFQEFLKKLGFREVKSYISSISAEAKALIKEFNLSFDVAQEGYIPEIVFLLDLNNPKRAPKGILKKVLNAKKIFIIDHHMPTVQMKNVVKLCKEYSSTSELITEIIYALGHEELLYDKKISMVLSAGILADSVMLKYISKHTLINYSLLSNPSKHRTIQRILARKRELSEKIALLKSLSRTSILRINDIIIAISQVGSFESSVATTLLKNGADVAIVIAPKREKSRKFYRIILRTKLDVNLAEIAHKITSELSGTGGGHKKAAALEVPFDVDIEFILKKILSLLSNELKAMSIKL